MKRNQLRATIGLATVFAAMTFFFGIPGDAVAKDKSRTVTARVERASGSGTGIHAERVPGQFTVPEGYVATHFKYHFHDPATDYTSTRLGPSSIYSVTHGRSIREAEGNSNFELPSGQYKFIVGGQPGAYGSLSFRLVSTNENDQDSLHDDDQTRRSSGTPGLPDSFDVKYHPMTDIYVSDSGGFKQLRDIEGIETWHWPTQVVVRFRNGQATSKFTLQMSGPGYDHTHTSTLVGTLSNGRFTGTETGVTRCRITIDDKPVTYRLGTVWALRGQVDSEGLLVLHGRWQSDIGEIIDIQVDGQGGHTVGTKPHTSGDETRSMRTRCHLRLRTTGPTPSLPTSTQDIAGPPPATPTWNGPETSDDRHDSIWGDSTTDDSREDPQQPTGTPSDQTDGDWHPADNTDRTVDENDSKTGETSDDGNEDEPSTPKIGDRLPDGKIWYRPPWDEGGAHPMDEQAVQDIRKRQEQGYRWDQRHGWVDDQRQKDIDDIADIERRGSNKEKRRTRETFDQLSDAEKKAKEHGDKAKRHGDMSIMHKVDALGLDSLTREEREQLPKTDDDIKDHLRGDPKTVRGYKRGIVDKTMSQGAIDKTYTILKGSKVVIDESMNYLESAGGPPGKAISKTYTITSTIAEKASKANADYNAGKTNRLDYDTAVAEGFKEGVTTVIVDEISGELNNHVTDRLLKSKAGKGARDLIESKAKQAKKAQTKKFLSGQTDSLNPTILEKAGDKARGQVKSKLNYGIGRTTKPGYDAILEKPVKKGVDWGTNSGENK